MHNPNIQISEDRLFGDDMFLCFWHLVLGERGDRRRVFLLAATAAILG